MADTNLIHRNETRICAARAFLKKGDDRQALQLAKLAKAEALTIKNVWFTPTPDRYGYGTARYLFDALVYVYAKAGRKDLAIRFIRSVQDEKMRMDQVICTAIPVSRMPGLTRLNRNRFRCFTA
ncbi:MAG: hypothetical protein U5R06_21675 [candidate division KSB1 bacterium]|nr:hypothetical protein [candidate division KSB1 bacterium]